MGKYQFLLTSAAIFVAAALSGCNSTDPSVGSYNSAKVYDKPLFGNIARKSAAYEGPARNPVIVIHGFLGARLKNHVTGKNVWGNFSGREALNGYSNNHLHQLSHPMGKGKKLDQLKDNVYAYKLLSQFNVQMLGVQFHLNAYNKMIEILTKAGYVPSHRPLPKGKNFYSMFTFYYDWRRDLPENAKRLDHFISIKRKYLQHKYEKLYGLKNFDVQFDIIAHSMGGLLSRYYLRYGGDDLPEDGSLPELDWKGSKYIDKLIIVGTPNAGYLDTCMELVNGLQIDPRTPIYPPSIIGTFATYYQMLPLTSTRSVIEKGTGKNVDMFDLKTWIKYKWGLANPNQDKYLKIMLPDVKKKSQRYMIAIDHLAKCLKRAKQFTEAMRVYEIPPKDVAMILFAGDAVKTSRQAEVDPKTGKLKVIKYEAGDGKVLASSARMDEREGREWVPFMQSPINWRAVIHLKAAHMGITESYAFGDNVSYYLLSFPTPKQSKLRKYLKEAKHPAK
ncbi:MAG: hypothetical protein GY750_15125 [Lentisphaerae bacterium]|nr:hypothetical protein [Lentisphaerota bacterium]MCP4102730.1 hypothetical protein [Lentisphaerota bacterium]